MVKVSGETDGTCIIVAQSKTGNAVITITLESGLKKTIKVKVQKGTVTATSLKLPFVKVTIKKGRTLTLKPVIRPITNQSKVTYSSSNKSIATVNGRGVIKGVKRGTAKITVKAGTKKVICTVVVKKFYQRRITNEKEKQNFKSNVTVNADSIHAGNLLCVGRGGNCAVPHGTAV